MSKLFPLAQVRTYNGDIGEPEVCFKYRRVVCIAVQLCSSSRGGQQTELPGERCVSTIWVPIRYRTFGRP